MSTQKYNEKSMSLQKNTQSQIPKRSIEPRFGAFKILFGVLEEQKFSHKELQRIFREYPGLAARDRALLEHIVRGTLEHLYEIDACLAACSKLPLKKLKPAIRTVLRLSAYQLLYLDRIPARAVCNEAVRLTNRLHFASLKGYVNGVLRTLIRKLEDGFSVILQEDSAARLQMQYSMPEWIITRYTAMFGFSQTEQLLRGQMEPVKLSVYRNPIAASSLDVLKEVCQAEGARCFDLPYGLDGLYLEDVYSLENWNSFQSGAFLVQDVSSMLQGKIVCAQEGNTILDVCAAPGGKTFHAALDMKGTGCVNCADISQEKTALIEENAKRFGLKNVVISVRDALVLEPSLIETADILIADLPCSGLGIIGRKPEIRYHITEEDVRALAALQRKILEVIWQYVKPGGRLIYSTCTLTQEEDEENYAYLTQELPFEPESLEPYLPQGPFADTLPLGYVKLIPGLHACDGFFIGSAVRKEK